MNKPTTKDKILEEALRQFNTIGSERVSIRNIAGALGISAGNLTYYFKNTDALVHQLYLNLVEDLNARIRALHQHGEPDFMWLVEQTEVTFRVMYQYKFLLLDFPAIGRRIEPIRTHFRQLMEVRKVEFRMLMLFWVEKGLLRAEWAPGLYDNLILQSMVLANAWIGDSELLFEGDPEQIIPHYCDLFIGTVAPFLTETGLEMYAAWREKGRSNLQMGK